jgi:nicotinamide phosphoribosyltransferase
MESNIILNTDSYKVSMWKQYPQGTEYVYSYVESRGGKFDRTVFFGLQMFLHEYLKKPITKEMIDEADEYWTAHGEPFNRQGWQYILKTYNGYLPVCIRAVPEGTVVPVGNVLLTIVNTDPKCFWLTTWLETALLRAIWYPTTVATNSYMCKQAIKTAMETSSDTLDSLDYKLVDFGARGVSSFESAGIGRAAHLLNFRTTDTMTGVLFAKKYYAANMAGYSIPAAEHSTITSWGRDHEVDAYRNMIRQFAKPGATLAVVSDSYDIMNAVNNLWGEELRQEIIDSGATVIVRPDSGDPLTVPVEVVEALASKFGFTINSKGYKVLPNYIRVIQGDGIDVDSLPKILANLLAAGFSADNLSFGMGGGMLQHVNRDTQKFAMKCSSIFIKGQWRDVYKDPVGDHSKSSKRGRLILTHKDGVWATEPMNGCTYHDRMQQVFDKGDVQRRWEWDEVLEHVNQG